MRALGPILLVTVFAASTHAQQDQTSWFDFEKCEICKHMSSEMEMMSAIKWESHMIPNGFLSIAVIPDQYKEKMEAKHSEMEKSIEKAKAGAEIDLCRHCQSYGDLLAQGAESTELKTVGGQITLMTSDDPDLVKKIQAHAQTSLDEFEKMMGHDHSH